MPRFVSPLLPFVVAAVLTPFSAAQLQAENPTIQQVLAREIIGPDLALAEVEDFCEARVPVMPEIDSVEEWENVAARLRNEVLTRIVYRGEAAQWRRAETQVQWLETIEGGEGYKIKKLRFEVVPGMWTVALLYEPVRLSDKAPVVLNVNGHDGKGKAAEYKQIRCINQAKRGMIALNLEWLGMGQLKTDGFQHYRMNQLDLCGTSGLAPFYLAMKRGLDILLDHKFADAERVAVAGLSGGGWQTIIISSLDTRVKLSNPVAGYSSFRTRVRNHSDLGDSEQTPNDLATVADYTHLTAMMAPRATLLTYNVKDNCCFASDHALPPLLDAARPIFKLYGREGKLASHVNHDPGTHNFERDNRQALYRMFQKHFYAKDASFNARELECDDELKTAEQLHVELPDDNVDFQTLALRLSQGLPVGGKIPNNPKLSFAQRRQVLKRTVRARDYTVEHQKVGEQEIDTGSATFWRLRLSRTWTVPAVEFTSKNAKNGAAIVIADKGRNSTATTVQKLLNDHRRVLAIDPFYLGESKIASRDFLFALLVAAVGDRPVGLQASQLGAVARWLKSQSGAPVTLVALGERCCLPAMIAAAIEEPDDTAIDTLQLNGSLGSLKEVIERNYAVNVHPEFFCFGLLQQFDIGILARMVAPRAVVFVDPSDRAQSELADLKDWYQVLGVDFDPLQ